MRLTTRGIPIVALSGHLSGLCKFGNQSRSPGNPLPFMPLVDLTKAEIIQQLGVDYGKTHSCYDPDPQGLVVERQLCVASARFRSRRSRSHPVLRMTTTLPVLKPLTAFRVKARSWGRPASSFARRDATCVALGAIRRTPVGMRPVINVRSLRWSKKSNSRVEGTWS